MEYRAAVQHAALVLDLVSKSKKYMRELFEPPDVRALSINTDLLNACLEGGIRDEGHCSPQCERNG